MSVRGGRLASMCGRYSTTMDPETLYGVFQAGSGLYGGDVPRTRPEVTAGGTDEQQPPAPIELGYAGPKFNIAPTTDNPVVRMRPPLPGEPDGPPQRRIDLLRWGLVPSWAKDSGVGNRLFNARAESVAVKPAFRRAVLRRRCLVPASGWFEWQRLSGDARPGKRPAKQAFYLTPEDGSVVAFAGLWEYWRPPATDSGDHTTAEQNQQQDPIVSYTILTTDSVGPLQQIHDRMPLVLPASDWEAWLDPARDDVTTLLGPPSPQLVELLELRPVGPRVGNVRFDDAGLLERVEPAAPVGRDTELQDAPMLPLG